ncbi:PEP-CTERM system TPR-repeat protein PrsT [Aestuariicella hydrocarbonica]|uniref:PEP-CTERM system TPR-repeat protein PrsT n=1 Tax=Pseudomaricurvus hydrocarbonicus TaxID=1470433 RepID=A0A9E5JQC7_9GAMM|nr:XrtA/PEP-CTERM system TPR-repeat protein PrsT [Aestuariicella hydrocarbonica]NHO64713.1 PEP-CTERM system TPR-repeat protein PrsT [Aestuariicella hydrocarbonica]
MKITCWVAAPILVCSLLLNGCDQTTDGMSYLDSANLYYLEGDYASSRIQLKKALQSNPENIEARWLLGSIFFAEENMPSAELELEKYIEFGGDVNLALPILSKIYVEQNKLRSLNQIDLSNLVAKPKSMVLASQSLGLLSAGQVQEAESKLRQAEALNSNESYVKLARAQIDLSKAGNDISEIQSLVESVASEDPSNALAWKLLGDIRQIDGDMLEAEANYTKAIKYSARNIRAHYGRAISRFRMEEVDKAYEDIEVIKRYSPKSVMYQYLNGVYQFSKGKNKAAIEALLVANETDYFPIANYYLSLANLAEGNEMLAENFAEEYFEFEPEDLSGRKLLAGLYLNSGKAKSVVRILAPLTEQDPEVMSLLARAYLELGQVEQSVELLTQISAVQPESPKVLMDLGNSYMMLGNKKEGLRHLQSAVALDDGYDPAHVSLVVGLVKADEYNKAIEIAKAYRDKNPGSYVSYNLLGLALWKSGDIEQAKEVYQTSVSLNSNDTAVYKALAGIAMEQGDVALAEHHYQKMLDIDPKNYWVMMKLAFINSAEEDNAQMIKYLKMAIEVEPEKVDPRVVLARYYLSKSEFLKVNVVLSGLPQKKMRDPAVLEVSAISRFKAQDYKGAARKLEHYTQINPDSVANNYLLAKAYAGMGRKKAMVKQLQHVIEMKPDFSPARLDLARQYLTEKKLDDALEQVLVVQKLIPDNLDALKVEYAIAKLRGNGEVYTDILQRIYSIEKTEDNLIELARVKKMSGERREAESLLNDWIQNNKKSIGARLELANLMSENGQKDKAIEYYKSTILIDGENYKAMNNIAWNLLESNPAESLEYAKKAVDKNPDSPMVLDTLALAYLHNGEEKLAQKTVKMALRHSPNDPQIIYHSAKIDVVSGDVSSAKRTLLDLLDKYPEFSSREDVAALLAEVTLNSE